MQLFTTECTRVIRRISSWILFGAVGGTSIAITGWIEDSLRLLQRCFLQPRIDEGELGAVTGTRDRTVVVVDEHVETRAILDRALTAAGYVVEQAPDGLTGLKLACRIHPALIIMEHPAYVYGGRALIESVQANVEMEHVSIVIVSSHAGRSDHWLEGHPCDAYLSKPFEMEELLNIASALTEDAHTDSAGIPLFSFRSPRRRRLPLSITRTPAAGASGADEPARTASILDVTKPPPGTTR